MPTPRPQRPPPLRARSVRRQRRPRRRADRQAVRRVAGRPLVAHTLAALVAVPRLSRILVVVAPDDEHFEGLAGLPVDPRLALARCGGATRARHRRRRARQAAPGSARRANDWVLVHDAARCLVRAEWIEALIDACRDDGSRRPARAAGRRHAEARRRRPRRRDAAARRHLAGADAADVPPRRAAPTRWNAPDADATDEAVGDRGARPAAEAGRRRRPRTSRSPTRTTSRSPRRCSTPARRCDATARASRRLWRIGEGWDTHALVARAQAHPRRRRDPAHARPARPFRCRRAAATRSPMRCSAPPALGDIGHHFPDTDAQYQGADSLALLAEAARRVRGAGWQIGNVDSTVIAQAPKLAPHIAAMRQRIASALGVGRRPGQREGQDGREAGAGGRRAQAIEARAVVLLPGCRGSLGAPPSRSERRGFGRRALLSRRRRLARFSLMCASQAASSGVGELEGAAHALHRLVDDRQARGRRRSRPCGPRRRGRTASSAGRASSGRRPCRGRARLRITHGPVRA